VFSNQHLRQNVTISFWEVKVKIQGANRHTENLALGLHLQYAAVVSDMMIFTKFGNLTSNFGMSFDKIPDGGPAEICTL